MLRYAIVDATCTTADATRLATSGIDYIQLRAKSLPVGQLAALARTILAAIAAASTEHAGILSEARRTQKNAGILSEAERSAAQSKNPEAPCPHSTSNTFSPGIPSTTPTQLLINTRADVAVATAAHGVHLTSSPTELTPQQVRQLYAASPTPYSLLPTPCTSLSCHTLADIARATTLAPDLILFGPIFEKRVSGELVQPGIGLPALEAAVRAAHGIPVLALGGITHRNTPACLEAGAAGIAAIRLFA